MIIDLEDIGAAVKAVSLGLISLCLWWVRVLFKDFGDLKKHMHESKGKDQQIKNLSDKVDQLQETVNKLIDVILERRAIDRDEEQRRKKLR